MCPIRFLSTLSPYSRKPSLFGPKMSICAKGVSRGVHNIAFLLSPDRFRAFDLFFFFSLALFRAFALFFFFAHILKSGHESQRAIKILQGTKDLKDTEQPQTWTGHRLVQKVPYIVHNVIAKFKPLTQGLEPSACLKAQGCHLRFS